MLKETVTQRKVGVYPALKEWELCMYWKKKTGAALQLGLFGFLFKIWLFKLGAKGLFWRILHGLRDWHQNLTFIWCTALSVSKWFSLEEMYPENVKKKKNTAQVKCTEEWKKGCFKVLKIKQAKEKKVKKKLNKHRSLCIFLKMYFLYPSPLSSNSQVHSHLL